MLEYQGTLLTAQLEDDETGARRWRQFHLGRLRHLAVASASSVASEDLAADTRVNVVRPPPADQWSEHGLRAWLVTTSHNRLTDWYRPPDRRLEVVRTASLPCMASPRSGARLCSVDETAWRDVAHGLSREPTARARYRATVASWSTARRRLLRTPSALVVGTGAADGRPRSPGSIGVTHTHIHAHLATRNRRRTTGPRRSVPPWT